MRTHQVNRLNEIPSYGWCGRDPSSFNDLSAIALAFDEPAIPELFSDVTGDSLPRVRVKTQAVDHDGLVRVSSPVKTVNAYWHCGWPHSVETTWLRREVADRLATATGWLPDGFGLAVWDGWRDPLLQAELHRVAYLDPELPAGFVNPPASDPTTPPPHATGGTVDLTLTWLGEPLNLGTTFDAFVSPALSDAFEDAQVEDEARIVIRNLRRLLRRVMTDAGFIQLDCEWWHFEYGTRLWAAIHQTVPLYAAASAPQAQ